MDLRNLELFLHLADSSTSAKAPMPWRSAPTLSRAIQRLEQETGCVLFERDNRSVRLTPAGDKLREFGGALLQEWRQLKQELKRSDEPLQGRLRVFCSVTASYFLLPEVLERFRRRYPQLEIKLETGDPALAVDKILADEADPPSPPARMPSPPSWNLPVCSRYRWCSSPPHRTAAEPVVFSGRARLGAAATDPPSRAGPKAL